MKITLTGNKNLWVTADLHFGHKNIMQYQNRPFKTVQEMDRMLIANWNQVVNEKDVVFCLGDITFKPIPEFLGYMNQLNGSIFIVPGNHDWKWTTEFENSRKIVLLPQIVSLRVVYDRKQDDVVLCHYPLRQWNKAHYGSFHAYGHTHGSLPGLGKSLDVGIDAHSYYPVSWKDFVSAVQDKQIIKHH